MRLWDEIAAAAPPTDAQPAIDAMHEKFGMVPNVGRALAENPGTLEGYLAMRGALGSDPLDALDVEAVSLAVSRVNGCSYCEAAHSGAAARLGADEAEIARNHDGASSDPRRDVLARLARRLAETAGGLPDDEVAGFRSRLSRAEMIAVVGWVAVNTITNVTNRLVRTERDLG